jgi:hypothetical protein
MKSERTRLANLMAAGAASESSRVAALIRNQNACLTNERDKLAKAAAFGQRNSPCAKLDLSGGLIGNTINSPVPQSSSKLKSDALACQLRGGNVNGPETGVPQSVWTARLQQRTLDLATNPFDSDTRFAAYRRPFVQVCPEIPQSYKNGGEPVLQGKRCALSNKPDNPVLPG